MQKCGYGYTGHTGALLSMPLPAMNKPLIAASLLLALIIGAQLGRLPWKYRQQIGQVQGVVIGLIVGIAVGRLKAKPDDEQ